MRPTRPLLATLAGWVLLWALGVGAAGAQASDSDAVVATVEGTPITLQDLDTRVLWAYAMESGSRLEELRRQTIQGLIAERLLEAEAARRGVTADGLVQAEVDDKLAPVTGAEARAWYDANVAKVRGRPFEVMEEQIKVFLQRGARAAAYEAYIDSLGRGRIAVEIPTHREEVSVPASSPVRGPRGAPVVIVMFSDFQDPYSVLVLPTLVRVREAYGDDVAVAFRHFPLAFRHRDAHRAAQAAQCAHDQGHFWAYHDRLFENQWSLTAGDLKQYAADIAGIDTARFDTCLDTEAHKATVDADLADGAAAGVNGVPNFYINGRVVRGAVAFELFKALVDEELGLGSAP